MLVESCIEFVLRTGMAMADIHHPMKLMKGVEHVLRRKACCL